MIGAYIKRLFVVLDIAVNVFPLFGNIETVSSRCGKQIAAGKPCRACAWLCRFIETAFNGRWSGHCARNRREPYK
jgi:hypothetical protein